MKCIVHLQKQMKLQSFYRIKTYQHNVIVHTRYYTNYFRGIPNFKPYRNKLVHLESQEEIINLLDEIETIFANEYSLA